MRSKWLWAIVALGLAARVTLLALAWDRPEGVFTPDSRDYWQLARSMDEKGCFAMDPAANWPEIFRTPGYPAYLLFWQHWHWQSAATTWRAALLMQIVLDCWLIVLTFLLGRRLAGERAGLVAAAFQAFTPLAVASSCRILSDSIFAFMFTLALLLIVRYFQTARDEGLATSDEGENEEGRGKREEGEKKRQRRGWQVWWPLLSAAIVLGLACYVRPVGIAMAAMFFTVLTAGHHGFRRAGAFAAIVIAICAPWVVRNSYVADYRGFSSFATDSYYKFAVPRILPMTLGQEEFAGYLDRNPPDVSYISVLLVVGAPAWETWKTPGQQARYRMDYDLKVVKEHPLKALKVHLTGDLAFWLPDAPDVLEVAGLAKGERGTLNVLHEQGLWPAVRHYFGDNRTAVAVAIPLTAVFVIKMLGVLACIIRRFSIRLPLEVWLVAMLVIVSALLPGPAAHPRFRVPVEPILSVAAAVGWLAVLGRRRAETRRGGGEDGRRGGQEEERGRGAAD